MDFESPDVEKDFPGLFASESVLKKCNESDFSDENHDKAFKKELIAGKKKDKRDSKKDKGYAALEGESSADENTDSKSPSKTKKSKSFKFPTKKSEKREKSREKDGKEKEPDKDKKKDKEKKEKDKIKQKDKKKNRHGEEALELNGDYPVFGVDLSTAVERSGCLDGIAIPLVIRNCIDCIHDSGLNCEGLYKTLGMKSKIMGIKRAYNLRETVSPNDLDIFVSGCLLKMFLRELPEPLLTNELLARFEEAGAIMEVDAREEELENLIKQLPYHNKVLLSWLIVHFDAVTLHEKQNKLNAQSIAMTFSPVLQMSHRLLTAFLCHCKALFPDTKIEKYVPPLCAGSSFPEKSDEIVNELRKQESLLNQIHKEMSQGFTSKKREEQLWEVQRIVTQLKRTLRTLQKSQETVAQNRNVDEDTTFYEENVFPEETKRVTDNDDIPKKCEEVNEEPLEAKGNEIEKALKDKEQEGPTVNLSEIENTDNISSPKPSNLNWVNDYLKNDQNLEFFKLRMEGNYLADFKQSLENRIENERQLIERLQSEIRNYRSDKGLSGETIRASISPHGSDIDDQISKLVEDNNSLTKKKDELIQRIFEEKMACIQIRVNIYFFELKLKIKEVIDSGA